MVPPAPPPRQTLWNRAAPDFVLSDMEFSRRRAAIGISAAILFAVPLVLVCGALLCENALRVPFSLRIGPDDTIASRVAEQHGAKWRSVEIQAADKVRLTAWLFLPQQGNGGGVIAFHGVSDSRRGVMAHVGYLLDGGYTVLTPDSRGHGSSGGDLMTFGLRERDDVARWARWMRHDAGVARLYALGESMGAAIALQSAGEFDAVVAESSFCTFRQIACYRVAARTAGLPGLPELLVESGFFYARARYGMDLGQASPLNCVSKSHVPLLLIHGTEDRNVPAGHARQLAAANPTAFLWLIPGAGHTAALQARPAETEHRILDWFNHHP